MSKTIEEIKDEYAHETSAHGWFDMTMRQGPIRNAQVDEVAERYAQSQTKELQEQNADLVDSLSKLVLLLEEIDSTLFHHNHSIDGWHLNGDLEPIMNFVNDMDLEPITEAKELLTKYNHLNKKP